MKQCLASRRPNITRSPGPRLPNAQEQAYVSTTFSGNAGPGGSPPAYPAGTVAAVNAQYPLSNYATPELQWNAMQTPGLYVGACKARHIDQIVGGQVPLYAYEFSDRTAPDYFPPMPGFQSLAYHTSDIQYYFPLWHGGDLGTPASAQRKAEGAFRSARRGLDEFRLDRKSEGASAASRGRAIRQKAKSSSMKI